MRTEGISITKSLALVPLQCVEYVARPPPALGTEIRSSLREVALTPRSHLPHLTLPSFHFTLKFINLLKLAYVVHKYSTHNWNSCIFQWLNASVV